MNTHRVTGILAWSALAVLIAWPTYDVLTRSPAGDADIAVQGRAVTTFPETAPLSGRVFGDQTLREMARAKPLNDLEMLEVKGIGPA